MDGHVKKCTALRNEVKVYMRVIYILDSPHEKHTIHVVRSIVGHLLLLGMCPRSFSHLVEEARQSRTDT